MEGLTMSGETERRRVRPMTRGLDELLALFERESAAQMTAGPATDDELRRVETAIGGSLPADLRAFLSRLGGGLYYHGHEIFGPLRVMVHDIEMVPDLVSVRERVVPDLAAAADLVPFHRARGTFHFFDRRRPGVYASSGERLFADLAGFLETIVVPRDAAASARPSK
jgi:hypothetical protein